LAHPFVNAAVGQWWDRAAVAFGGFDQEVGDQLRDVGLAFAQRWQLDADHVEAVEQVVAEAAGDRKSTRLNSSHVKISYAVFCLHPERPPPTRVPYTTLFRSPGSSIRQCGCRAVVGPGSGSVRRLRSGSG